MSYFLVNLISSLKLCSLILLLFVHYSFLLFNFNISFDLNVGWLSILLVARWGVWLDQFLALFLLEVSSNLGRGVGGLLGFSLGISLDLCVSLDVGFVVFVLRFNSGSVFPLFIVLSILNNLRLSGSWGGGLNGLLRFLVHVDFRFSLDKVAVLESALDEMEEVSNEFGLLFLINTFEEFRVHLFLKELVGVNLQIGLEESLFSKSNLVHVGVHAHGFDFGHHLGLGLELGSLNGGSQKENSNRKFHVYQKYIIIKIII